MLFNTWPYLFFLPLAVLGFYATPGRLRWIWLVVASSVFLLLGQASFWMVAAAITLITWTAGRLGWRNPTWIWVGLAANLAVLVFFKYHHLLPRADASLGGFLGIADLLPDSAYLLPLGISYYVFQAIGYLLEIKRKSHLPEPHFGRFAAYLLFFPKLLAGPIERAHEFLPQLNKRKLGGVPEYENLSVGFRLILWGLFKKMCVADRLDPITEQVFYFAGDFHGMGVLLGVLLYPIQLYADFSAYTDIAIGSARLFGLRLSPNFDRPFEARNIAGFWRRWHMSLSSWVNEYIYTPLSLRLTMQYRLGRAGVWIALVVSFLILGVWHGANYTFLIFGALQGVALALEAALQPVRTRVLHAAGQSLGRLLGMVLTFSFFAFSCIFFRAGSMDQAMTLIGNIPLATAVHPAFFEQHFFFGQLGITTIFVVLFLWADHLVFRQGFERWAGAQSVITRWLVYAFMLFCVFCMSGLEPGAFVYNQF